MNFIRNILNSRSEEDGDFFLPLTEVLGPHNQLQKDSSEKSDKRTGGKG